MKRAIFFRVIFFTVILFSWPALLCQEFRSTSTVTANSQPITVDLTGVTDVSGASITFHNSSTSTVSLPLISTPAMGMPISGPAILAQMNSLPPSSTDQDRAIQAWQFMLDRSFAFCSAGKKGTPLPNDPVKILSAFGFGCCDQLAQTLAWIWQQEGYQARVAEFPFHTVPEIYYDETWHMLDPDHRVYYSKDDGSIASVAEILADTNLISRTADSNGLDPVGYLATTMANLYADNASALQYIAPFYQVSTSTDIRLRPHEGLTFHSDNLQNSVLYYDLGSFLGPSAVNSSEFDWDLSFGNSEWKVLAASSTGVETASDALGSQNLVNSGSTPGSVIYAESSVFPVLRLTLEAQLGTLSSGSLQAYFSSDGTHWSNPVSFQIGNTGSSFDLGADLSPFASAAYSYFVKIELDGGVQLHRLRISPIVQTSKTILPRLTPASVNEFLYQDSAPVSQTRSLEVTTSIPLGSPQIHRLHAASLVPESRSQSLAFDYGAANLVDGDPDSLAYPGSSHLDYVVQLNGTYNIHGLSIDWGYFGSDPRYVQSWQILGRNGNDAWKQLASGGPPGQATMDLLMNSIATELRLVADSTHWIGVYDIRAFGNSVGSVLPTSSWNIESIVPEDPVYSTARHYSAANLIDGDTTTLAYPAAKNLNYQISLGGKVHLSAANIVWGYFGALPGYIDSWSLLTRNGADQPWVTISQGGFPQSTNTLINLDCLATDVRIVASSALNWIGIYDLQLSGGQLMGALTISSNVPAEGGTSSSHPLANLSDDDETSFAYPGNLSLDYKIDPGQTAYFDSVRIVWGSFGANSQYVQSWRILGLTPDGRWEVAVKGGFPNSTETVAPIHNRYRKLRIAADGANWIGIYEVQVFGDIVPPPGQFTVRSNVSEDPVYSLGQHYQASNLIDGDPTTLAYPASTHIDYQISLAQPTQLSSAFIDWGVFGTNQQYVNSWSILARSSSNQPWVTLGTGGFPNSATTVLSLDFVATDVRIVADSVNWVGIYEMQIKGVSLQ